jgi:hypothetical protein
VGTAAGTTEAMIRRAAGAAAVIALLTAARVAEADEPDDGAFAVDASGRTLRVAFDPGRTLEIGAGWAASRDSKSDLPSDLTLRTGLTYRHRIEFPDEGITWKLTHEVGHTWFSPADHGFIVGELYALRFLRWSRDGSIVFPSSPPRRIGFPLGLGFEVGAGSVDLERDDTLRGEVGVGRGALLFDVVRSPAHGAWLTLGVGPRYALRVAEGHPVDHLVVPFSEPELAGHLELGGGHHVLSANVGGGYAWMPRHPGGAREARGALGYAIVVAALNDAPVSLRADASFRADDPPLLGRPAVEFRGGASAVLGLPLGAR